jgi:hypothetical protein
VKPDDSFRILDSQRQHQAYVSHFIKNNDDIKI